MVQIWKHLPNVHKFIRMHRVYETESRSSAPGASLLYLWNKAHFNCVFEISVMPVSFLKLGVVLYSKILAGEEKHFKTFVD